jgi:heme oxygenase (biliverdin-IX-beta and delta-forming)
MNRALTSPITRRFALRERTTGAHAALDAAVGPLTDAAAYARYLRALHAFRAPAERVLAAACWSPAPIAALIAADMADLGIAPRPEMTLPAPRDRSGELGLAYVLEGSALGARLLQRQALALGLRADHGARHLAAQTHDLDGWRAFLATLEGAEPFDLDAAVGAAVAGFAAAERAFADGS